MPHKNKKDRQRWQRKYRENNKQAVLDSNDRYHRTNKGLFARLKQKAKKRNIAVSISFEDFEQLRVGFCVYCSGNLPPSHDEMVVAMKAVLKFRGRDLTE